MITLCRLVYKLSGLPAGCQWTNIRDALKEIIETQVANTLLVLDRLADCSVDRVGCMSATQTVPRRATLHRWQKVELVLIHALLNQRIAGNKEAWTAAAGLGDKLKVMDTVIRMTAVEVPTYWICSLLVLTIGTLTLFTHDWVTPGSLLGCKDAAEKLAFWTAEFSQHSGRNHCKAFWKVPLTVITRPAHCSVALKGDQ